jgi:ubiquinone/menaquinone biosynthesis C-methylase UbiE
MISQTHPLFQKFYAGHGHDKTRLFFGMIREAAGPQARVLNLGAGPGTGYAICNLKGEFAELVGADIDPDVLNNSEIDTPVIIENGKALPFAEHSFDLVYSDYVVEHVEFPEQFLAEIRRVLKPGASYFFRTPNIYHYVALISRFTPHWFHEWIANPSRGLPEETHDPYPTFYRLNTRRAVRRAARKAGFSKTMIEMVEGHPSYLVFHALPFLCGVAYERAVNSTSLLACVRANMIGRLTK